MITIIYCDRLTTQSIANLLNNEDVHLHHSSVVSSNNPYLVFDLDGETGKKLLTLLQTGCGGLNVNNLKIALCEDPPKKNTETYQDARSGSRGGSFGSRRSGGRGSGTSTPYVGKKQDFRMSDHSRKFY